MLYTSWFRKEHTTTVYIASLEDRLGRLERSCIVLLKRVLELDGMQLKNSAFTDKVMQTPDDNFNKGLNEPGPTIH